MNNKNKSKKAVKTQIRQKESYKRLPANINNKWVWFALSLVLVITFIIYLKSIGFGFIDWDDTAYISNNQDIKNIGWENIKMFFTKFYVCNYQPITILMYAVEYKFAGLSASLYHFNNMVIHILNTCLVFVLIRKISPRNAEVALITAAFFAVHPMHVESVAWVAERKDVLYSFFFLLSLVMYAEYLKLQKLKYLIYAVVFFVLSCMSKSAAVIIPLVMLVFDYYFDRKFSWKMILEKIPFFAISLIFGIIAVYSQKGAVRDNTIVFTFFERISIVSYTFIDYILKAFVPVHCSAIYPYPVKSGGVLPLLYILAPFAIGIILIFIFISRKWGKTIIFGFLFFVISIVLVLQIFPVGDAAMADRYTYIPYVGIFFLTGKLYEFLFLSPKQNLKKYKPVFLVVLISAFLLFSFLAFNRVKVWENEETLFNDVIVKFPSTSLAYNNVGCRQLNIYAIKKYEYNPELKNIYLEKAENNFTKAIQYTPAYVLFYLNRGITRFHRGNFKEAINDIDTYISVYQNNAEAYNYKGKSMGSTGNFFEAINNFNKAIEINPEFMEAYGNRYIAKYQVRDLKGAIQDCEKVLSLNPNDERALNLKLKAQKELRELEN